MNLSSSRTKREMRSVRAAPSNRGKAMRSAERLRRYMLRSGLKRRISLLGFLYAFMPSKASKA